MKSQCDKCGEHSLECKCKPNQVPLVAMRESKEGKGIKCESIKDFWEKMGMNHQRNKNG